MIPVTLGKGVGEELRRKRVTKIMIFIIREERPGIENIYRAMQ